MASPFSKQQHSPRRSRHSRRQQALSVDTGTRVVARQGNVSPYEVDSDSDTEEFRTRRKQKRASILLKSGREFLGRIGGSREFEEGYDSAEEFPPINSAATRDDELDDECVILTDDEDDGSETDEPPKKPRSELEDSVSPRSSTTPNSIAAIQSMFAEKHPWRRQSRRGPSKPYSSHGPRLPTVDSMEDVIDEPSSARTTTSLRDRIAGLSILQSRSEEEEDVGESSSSSEDEASTTYSSVSIISDPEEELDFAALESIPSYFSSHPEAMLTYLDPSTSDLSERDSNVFAYEHSLLLRAVLQLLAERDYIGVEADINDPTCIVKKGPLKKATVSVGRGTTWRVKYVEIRPGSFSYFEDKAKRDNFGRKAIPLRSSKCTCEVLKKNLIALKVEGGPTRLFMTNSDDECQAWVRAIRDAMIGAGAGDSNHSFDASQYQNALDQFQETQRNLFRAKTRDEYMSCVEELLQTNIRVPAQWVNDRANLGGRRQSARGSNASAINHSFVTGFWKSLKGDSVAINGCVVTASSPHSVERVIGALSRCILELDKSSPIDSAQTRMSELQALSFSRDVMMNVLRSRSRDESRAAVEYLCLNPALVTIEPLEDAGTKEPLTMQVSYATPDTGDSNEKDFAGWVPTRTRLKGMWRNRYLVISDGILNVFEHSSPRPHGLRGQLLLAGANVSVVKDKPKNESDLCILRIISKNKEAERQLSFPDEDLLVEWKSAIEKAMDSFSSSSGDEEPSALVTPRASMIPSSRIIQGASESGVKIINRATDQFMKATDMLRASMRSSGKSVGGPHSRSSSTDMRGADAETSESFGLSTSFETEAILKQEPTVQITAESTSLYRIVEKSTNVSGSSDSGKREALATVRLKMLHTFLLSGGSNGGRLTKGDDLVELEVRRGVASATDFVPSESQSP